MANYLNHIIIYSGVCVYFNSFDSDAYRDRLLRNPLYARTSICVNVDTGNFTEEQVLASDFLRSTYQDLLVPSDKGLRNRFDSIILPLYGSYQQ